VTASFAQAIQEEIYFEHIKSVKLHHSSLPTSAPIVDLNSSGKLKLSFDDMEGGIKDYVYSIRHCDKDWNRSIINEMEYLDGFNEEDITSATFSSQTIHDYTHYELVLPNTTTQWKVSGNYVITVLDEDNGNQPVLTKRFMVVEPLVIIPSSVMPAFNAELYNTHQRVDFKIDLNKFAITDAMNEVYVTILQNNRWDNAISNIKPLTAIGEQINFNKFGTSTFPASREFRYFDTRDIQINSDRTEAIEINTYSVDVLLKKDRKRENKNYIFYREGNGAFVPNYQSTTRNGKATSEYTNVIFTLDSPFPMEGYDVYIVGEFSSWNYYPENIMTYNEEMRAYQAELLLKQGYYNYLYAAIDDRNEVNFDITEGNWFEAENDYTILVYYRRLGSRYDRLIGVGNTNSLNRN
jgi:hypothetical protein